MEKREPCRFLKTKAMPQMQETMGWHNEEFPPGHYWCINTMGPVGPDDEVVAPEKCCENRECYSSWEV